jgi:hypothetical protein
MCSGYNFTTSMISGMNCSISCDDYMEASCWYDTDCEMFNTATSTFYCAGMNCTDKMFGTCTPNTTCGTTIPISSTDCIPECLYMQECRNNSDCLIDYPGYTN